jgi:integrase
MSSGNIRRQSKGSWQLKFDISKDPVTGERRTRYATFKGSKKDAQAELTFLINESNRGTYIDPTKMTTAGYLNYWLENYARAGASASALERWTEIIEKHLIPALGSIFLKNLSPVHIQQCYTDALREGRRDGNGGLAALTVKHHHAVLFQALKQAVGWQILIRNPADAVKPPKVEHKEIEFLTKLELADLLKSTMGTPLYTPLLLKATTGMRRGEVLALRASDLDFDRGTLTVNQALVQTEKGLHFKPPKTKKGRRLITLPALTISALKKHMVHRQENQLSMGLGRDTSMLVFARPDGEPWSPRVFSQRFKRHVTRHGFKPVTLHGLRHTHVSHLLMDGVHVKVVSERVGHSSVSMTLDKYSHVIPNLQEDAAKIVDTQLRNLLS